MPTDTPAPEAQDAAHLVASATLVLAAQTVTQGLAAHVRLAARQDEPTDAYLAGFDRASALATATLERMAETFARLHYASHPEDAPTPEPEPEVTR